MCIYIYIHIYWQIQLQKLAAAAVSGAGVAAYGFRPMSDHWKVNGSGKHGWRCAAMIHASRSKLSACFFSWFFFICSLGTIHRHQNASYGAQKRMGIWQNAIFCTFFQNSPVWLPVWMVNSGICGSQRKFLWIHTGSWSSERLCMACHID